MRKFKSILIIFICLVVSHSTYAYDYDPLLIRAQASIFPKIIMLDKNINKKVKSNEISIAIVYSEQDKLIAQNLKQDILAKYISGLGKNSIKVYIVNFNRLTNSDDATAYYILKSSNQNLSKATSYAATKNRIAFCYDYKDFKSNALISILVKEKTYIYLNKTALQKYNIKFLPLFYKIAKIIE